MVCKVKRYSCAKAELRLKQKTMGEGRGDKAVVDLTSHSWRCLAFELVTFILLTPEKLSVTSLITFTSNLSFRYQSRGSGLLTDRPVNLSMTLESTVNEPLSSPSSLSDSSRLCPTISG